jgi:uncharacterized membrane protein (DUF485 family)
MAERQNYSNHARWVPLFHFFVLPVLLANFFTSVFRWRALGFSWGWLIGMLTALALFILAVFARTFALKVQDRVIRMEERQRCERLLPTELKSRIEEITADQFVALRFASDSELPGLVNKVLADKISNRKTIKQMVKTWRGDYLRA